jgi:repressor LexA
MGMTKKQLEVYQFICNYWDKNAIAPTQREIKEHFGLRSFGSVQRYVKYLQEQGLLESDWNERRGLKPKQMAAPDNVLNLRKVTPVNSNDVEIPLLGDIAAGNPIEAIENPSETLTIPGWMMPSSKGRHFALRVKGDSMIEDGILDGDYAILRYETSASAGQTVAAVVEGEATLKRFYKTPKGVELQPANKNYKPILVTKGNFKIAGILVALVRSYARP